MATPTITSVSPATIVAGAAPVTVTIGGSNFLTAPTVTIGDLQVASVVEAGGNSITCKVRAPGRHVRGPLDVVVTNTDAGTVTDTGAVSVITAAVNSNADQYGYANPLPGSTPGASVVGVMDASVVVESGSLAAPSAHPYVDMVGANGMRSETSHAIENPAYAVTEELAHGGPSNQSITDGLNVLTPVQEAGLPPHDVGTDNPGATENTGDVGFQVGDEHSAQLPLAPHITSATAGASGHATVNWTAPVDPDGYAITGYEIVATSSDGGTTQTYEVGNVLTVNAGSLTSSKHYTFTVAAKNIAGTGPVSAASSSVAIS